MYILNTTFLIANEVIDSALNFIETSFLGVACGAAGFSGGRIARVLNSAEDGAESFAVQFETEDIAKAEEWLAAEAQSFFEELRKSFGERVLFFSTWLEVVK